MHCIGKEKPLTAASWTQPKSWQAGGYGQSLKSGICFKVRKMCVTVLIVVQSGMLNEPKRGPTEKSSQSD